MTIDALLMFAGAFVATLPFLGFPNSWDTVLFFCAGVFIVGLGIVVRRSFSKAPRNEGSSRESSAHENELAQ